LAFLVGAFVNRPFGSDPTMPPIYGKSGYMFKRTFKGNYLARVHPFFADVSQISQSGFPTGTLSLFHSQHLEK
jgi:hypothetical protein